jgi:osmoprotectant transport system permease protein
MEYTSSNILAQMYQWFTFAGHWSGPDGIPARTLEHLGYTGLSVLLAALAAVPLGLYVGHTGRGRVAVIAVAGVLRALPTLGMVALFVLLAGRGLLPHLWALVLLAVPPLLAGVYAGIASVDRTVTDAARSMGMTELQILLRVELPNGVDVILGGLRTAVLQVLATAAVVAFISLGGLGRFLFDGMQLRDNGQLFGGAAVIVLLALAVDALLGAGQRLAVPRGLRKSRRITGPGPAGQPARSPTAVRRETTAGEGGVP